MSRKKKLILNTATGLLKQAVSVICGFILPRYMLVYFGSDTNGLVTSVTHFLSFISFLDMGVGAVIQSNLYGPLARKDWKQISALVVASNRFFRRLGLIFLVYIAGLVVFFPLLTDNGFAPLFSASLIIVIAISTFAQYFWGMTNQLLLNADQKSYVQLSVQIVTILLNTVLSVVLMKNGASVHVVKLAASCVYVLRPILQAVYVRKKYDIDRAIHVVGEPIEQKWNGFAQHLASVVTGNIDVVALTVLSSLKNVSIYSVYYTVVVGVEQIVMTAATGMEALFGNMLAQKEEDKLRQMFSLVEWITHTVVTIVFTIAGLTILPFVSIYTKGIQDTDYIVPAFSALLIMAHGFECLRIPYFRMIKAAGHFKQTQNGAFITAIINAVLTLAMVKRYGLVGAATGTLAAMFYHTAYFVYYLKDNILHRPGSVFIKHLLVDILCCAISIAIRSFIPVRAENYLEWILTAVKMAAVVICVEGLVNSIFYRKKIKKLLQLLRRTGDRA